MISHHKKFALTYGTMHKFMSGYVDTKVFFRVNDEVMQPVLTSEIWTISGSVGYGVWEIGVEKRKEYKR